MKLKKYARNPILGPSPENDWESSVVTNPAAWYDEKADEFIMIYRAAGHDDKHLVYLGMAKSKDGLHFERCSKTPLFSPPETGADMGCMEDPRIVKFGDYFFITYASRMNPPGKYWDLDKGDFSKTSYVPPHFRENMPEELPIALLLSTAEALKQHSSTLHKCPCLPLPAPNVPLSQPSLSRPSGRRVCRPQEPHAAARHAGRRRHRAA